MLTILSWMLGSSIGRKTTLVGLAVLMVLLILWRVYVMGQKSTRRKDLERTLGHLKERIHVTEDVINLNPDERRERLSRWVHDG